MVYLEGVESGGIPTCSFILEYTENILRGEGMTGDPGNSLMMVVIINDYLVPLLVDFFYENGEGVKLRNDLQKLILAKSQEGSQKNFYDVFRLLDEESVEPKFEGLTILISNVKLIGYADFRYLMNIRTREFSRSLADDPIVNGRATGGITQDLYQEYASYRIKDACITMMMEALDALFCQLPLGQPSFMSEPLANLSLYFSFTANHINSVEDMIKANMVKFDFDTGDSQN